LVIRGCSLPYAIVSKTFPEKNDINAYKGLSDKEKPNVGGKKGIIRIFVEAINSDRFLGLRRSVTGLDGGKNREIQSKDKD
jgi:hypothetical protein